MWFKKKRIKNRYSKSDRYEYQGQLKFYELEDKSEVRDLYFHPEEPICWYNSGKYSDSELARKVSTNGVVFCITGYFFNKIFKLRDQEIIDNRDVICIVPYYQGSPGEYGTMSFKKFINDIVNYTGDRSIISKHYEMR